MMHTAREYFFSLDRQSHSDTDYIMPDRYAFLEKLSRHTRYIPRGAGLSYVAASFGTNSVSLGLSKFDRILAFDADEAAPRITVEAGASLHKLHLFLCPQRLRVPVEPGHPQISIGGCIAFNVCGKNQFREGLFDSCVEEFELFHPHKGLLTCSRSQNKELFELTIGGMGLTGIILKATLRLQRIPSAWLQVKKVPFRGLHHMVDVMRASSRVAESLHTFNDFTSFDRNLGQGFVFTADFDVGDEAPRLLRSFKNLERRATIQPSFFNRITVPAFNSAYRMLHTKIRPMERMPFYKFNYPVASTPFYFDWYGKKGFVERQVLVPDASVERYIERFEALLRKHRPLIVFGSCKLFSGERRHLQFAGSGLVISIDTVPAEQHRAFHEALDALNVEMSAIDNIAKDSRITRDLIAHEYPHYGMFRELLARHDPERQFASALSDTLQL